jgi:type I restriction enzyme S subunit
MEGVRLISHEHFVQWTRKARPQEWDVILSRRCNPGETAVVPAGLECALGQNLVLLRTDRTKVAPEFLRWLVRSSSWWEQVQTFLNVGAVFDSLKCADVPSFALPIPPLAEQRAIAHILGTLDDKIELNRRMSETLESIARALFQSWFVDFDPVRAKSEGRDTGLPKHIADLFPDSFEESELGEIPRGWRICELSRVAKLFNAAVKPAADPAMQWEHYSIPAFDEGRRPKIERGSEIKSNKFRVPTGSILVSKLNPQTPRVWLTVVRSEAAAVCSTEFMPFVPVKSNWRSWIYVLTLSPGFQAEILDRVTGSTGSRQRVSPGEIAELPIVRPPDELIESFGEVTGPALIRSTGLVHDSIALEATRDTLLPRLISGELRVRDAERSTGANG